MPASQEGLFRTFGHYMTDGSGLSLYISWKHVCELYGL